MQSRMYLRIAYCGGIDEVPTDSTDDVSLIFAAWPPIPSDKVAPTIDKANVEVATRVWARDRGE